MNMKHLLSQLELVWSLDDGDYGPHQTCLTRAVFSHLENCTGKERKSCQWADMKWTCANLQPQYEGRMSTQEGLVELRLLPSTELGAMGQLFAKKHQAFRTVVTRHRSRHQLVPSWLSHDSSAPGTHGIHSHMLMLVLDRFCDLTSEDFLIVMESRTIFCSA